MTLQRIFMPGSDCVYLKIYTGKKMSDELLLNIIRPVIQLLKKKNYISNWFFIRYNDPEFHIRIRLFITNRMLFGPVVDIFYSSLLRWKSVNYLYKVQIDTYVRELERYGGILIEEAEFLFGVDSECVLSILSQLGKKENYRWMIAVKMINDLLVNFDLNLYQRQIVINRMSENFKREFGFNLHNSKQFNSIYRKNKIIVESVLTAQIADPGFCKLCCYVNSWTISLNTIVQRIKVKVAKNPLLDLDSLLSSYIHMTMNRLFPDKARMHELIIYDMVNRFYISTLAKEKYSDINV